MVAGAVAVAGMRQVRQERHALGCLRALRIWADTGRNARFNVFKRTLQRLRHSVAWARERERQASLRWREGAMRRCLTAWREVAEAEVMRGHCSFSNRNLTHFNLLTKHPFATYIHPTDQPEASGFSARESRA